MEYIKDDLVVSNFDKFLDDQSNERIIFSGIFGIGKTSFLNNFFKNHDKYFPIHIYPVNYSIASNEDIFELIKYDILYELLGMVELEKTNFKYTEVVTLLDNTEQYKILKSFLDAVTDLGKNIHPMFKIVPDLLGTVCVFFETLKEKTNELNVDDGKFIEKLFQEFSSRKGSIYENDFYSDLITKLISKAKSTDKEIILIVDDLDRIDPEHIFRIINIFAAHFDLKHTDEKNKFGLNRIILSCDINNVRNIFKNKYGNSVDFNGYIDKFYSIEVYNFDNRVTVLNTIEKVYKSIIFSNPDNWGLLRIDTIFITFLLSSLVLSKRLNFRSIVKLYHRTYPNDAYYFIANGMNYSSKSFPLLKEFDFLSYVFGSNEGLIDALADLELMNLDTSRYPNFIAAKKQTFCNLLMLADYKVNKLGKADVPNRQHNKYPFIYTLVSGKTYNYHVAYSDSNTYYAEIENTIDITNDDLKELLTTTIKIFFNLKNGIES